MKTLHGRIPSLLLVMCDAIALLTLSARPAAPSHDDESQRRNWLRTEGCARRGYVFHENTPLFPFGYGLSYTTFSIGEPSLDREQISANGAAKVSVKVTNTGTRAGDQVVQMYVHHSVSSVVQPVIVLRGFKRVHLEAGASATVSFEVGPDQLSILDAQMKKTVEPGPVEIRIGSSSAETSSVRLTIIE